MVVQFFGVLPGKLTGIFILVYFESMELKTLVLRVFCLYLYVFMIFCQKIKLC